MVTLRSLRSVASLSVRTSVATRLMAPTAFSMERASRPISSLLLIFARLSVTLLSTWPSSMAAAALVSGPMGWVMREMMINRITAAATAPMIPVVKPTVRVVAVAALISLTGATAQTSQ